MTPSARILSATRNFLVGMFSPYHEIKTAFHEAGHTLVGLKKIYNQGVALKHVTIDPLCDFSLWNLIRHPSVSELSKLIANPHTKNDIATEDITDDIIYGDIVVLLAGLEAMEFFPRRTSAISNFLDAKSDLAMASELAQTFVRRQQTCSDINTFRIEVKKILEQAREEAAAILLENKKDLELLAVTLLKKKSLSGAEVFRLFNLPEPAGHG